MRFLVDYISKSFCWVDGEIQRAYMSGTVCLLFFLFYLHIGVRFCFFSSASVTTSNLSAAPSLSQTSFISDICNFFFLVKEHAAHFCPLVAVSGYSSSPNPVEIFLCGCPVWLAAPRCSIVLVCLLRCSVRYANVVCKTADVPSRRITRLFLRVALKCIAMCVAKLSMTVTVDVWM